MENSAAETGQGRITDEKRLGRDRLLMGLGYILHHSEENAIGAVPVKIIASLGGDDRHMGLLGSASGVATTAQFLGAYMLKWKKSDCKAMVFTMGLGFAFAASIALLLWFGKAQLFQGAVLPAYLLLALLFAVVGGMQLNIESGWIGDLVPRNRLGWFTSLKWILSVIGMFVFVFTIARVADSFPTRAGYASIYGLFAFSFLCAATLVYPRVTDRIPRPANYFSAGPSGHDRLNYKSLPFLCYAAYLVLWAGGRTVFFAFTNVYLIHHFKMSLTGIASLQAIQYAASIIAIYCFGRIADRLGSRIPLLWITGIVGASMILYPASAWLGVTAVVAFQFVNGLAGHGHGMLLINYGLEIFPDKGRAAYIGVSRALGGIASILSPILGGGLAYLLGDFHLAFDGADLNRYHVIFLIAMLITLSSLVPLLIASDRTVREA